MLQLMGGWEPDPPALHVRRDVSIQLHVGIFINETWHGLSGRAQLGTAWLARLARLGAAKHGLARCHTAWHYRVSAVSPARRVPSQSAKCAR